MADRALYARTDSVIANARRVREITPHDTNELDPLPKALYIEVAGDIVVVAADDSSAVTMAVPANFVLPVRAKIVKSTGTTATGIFSLS